MKTIITLSMVLLMGCKPSRLHSCYGVTHGLHEIRDIFTNLSLNTNHNRANNRYITHRVEAH